MLLTCLWKTQGRSCAYPSVDRCQADDQAAGLRSFGRPVDGPLLVAATSIGGACTFDTVTRGGNGLATALGVGLADRALSLGARTLIAIGLRLGDATGTWTGKATLMIPIFGALTDFGVDGFRTTTSVGGDTTRLAATTVSRG